MFQHQIHKSLFYNKNIKRKTIYRGGTQMEWSLLLLLLCPLMMIFMMFGMKGMPGHGSHSNQSQVDWTLHEDFNELKVENERLKKQLNID